MRKPPTYKRQTVSATLTFIALTGEHMSIGTNEQISKTMNQLSDRIANVITVPCSPDGGVINSDIQQDDISEDIQIKSTANLQLKNELVGLSKE
jgi:hypothetical protein